MSRKGLSASRISAAHLVMNAVFAEAVRNKKLAESPCTDIPLPGRVAADHRRAARCRMVERTRRMVRRALEEHRTLNQAALLRLLPDGLTDLDHFRPAV